MIFWKCVVWLGCRGFRIGWGWLWLWICEICIQFETMPEPVRLVGWLRFCFECARFASYVLDLELNVLDFAWMSEFLHWICEIFSSNILGSNLDDIFLIVFGTIKITQIQSCVTSVLYTNLPILVSHCVTVSLKKQSGGAELLLPLSTPTPKTEFIIKPEKWTGRFAEEMLGTRTRCK